MAGLAALATFGLRFVAKNQASAELHKLAKDYKVFNFALRNGLNEIGTTVSQSGLKQKIALGTAGLVGQQMIQQLSAATSAVSGAFKSSLKDAASFQEEMQMFSVISGKTGDELTELKNHILKVTGPLPTSANQVARAATAFARMGFAADSSAKNLINLSNEAIMFGRAIRVSDEQAALFLGKLATWLNVTDKSAKSLGRVASVVTRLGWRIKGTSQDIIKATERFGAFVRAMGATEVETLALAGLVVDSGILIRRGSTAINRTFQLMAVNTRSFGKAMKQMGMIGSAQDFEQMFRTKPVKAFELVLKGLAKQGGANAASMLKQLGLHGNYISDLITMSRNVDKLDKLTKEGNEEIEKQGGQVSATQKAFDEYSKTLNASIAILKGAWQNVKIIIGSPLLGILAEIFQAVAETLTLMVGTTIGRGMLYLLGVLLAIVAAGLVMFKVYTMVTLALAAMGNAGLKSAVAMIKIFLIAIAVIVALVALITIALWLWKKFTGQGTTLKETSEEVIGGIKDFSGKTLAATTGGMIPAAGEQAASERRGSFAAKGLAQMQAGRGIGVGEEGGGFRAAMPEIALPPAQHGGVFVEPTPVVIGEAGPEVAMSTRDFAMMMEGFADKIATAITENGGGSGEVTVNTPVTLDGQVVAQSVSRTGELDNLRKGILS